MSPRFSIIIPTYNVEKYIARCLESCINQTYKDIEIIIVDDKGNDKSIEIAKSYTSKDKRVKIVENIKNLGTFHTRIEGIKVANGEYLLFVDADDYIELNTCEVLDKAIEDSYKQDDIYPDIIHFKMNFISINKNNLITNIIHKVRYLLPIRFSHKPLRDEEIAFNFFLSSYHFPKFTIWDKAYKKTLVLESIKHLQAINKPLNMAEDMLKFFVISLIAKRYISVDKRLYNYCLNNDSITKNNSLQTILKRQNDMKYIQEKLNDISNIKELKFHKYTQTIKSRIQNNLQSLIILEERFAPLNSMGEGAESTKIPRCWYLKVCLKSLKYWNRNLTYIRIVAYIFSLGIVKL